MAGIELHVAVGQDADVLLGAEGAVVLQVVAALGGGVDLAATAKLGVVYRDVAAGGCADGAAAAVGERGFFVDVDMAAGIENDGGGRLNVALVERGVAEHQIAAGIDHHQAFALDFAGGGINIAVAAVGRLVGGGEAQISGCGFGCGGCGADLAAVFNFAGRGEHQLALGLQGAGVFHAQAFFVGNQGDAACIHAAQGCGVDGKCGLGAGGAAAADFAACIIDFLRAGGDGELIGLDFALHGGGAAEDFGVARAGAACIVEAARADGNRALADVELVQRALFNHRCAGGEHGAVGVFKAAAVYLNAGRVGDNHVCPAAFHADDAGKFAGAGAADFVENHFGAAFG